MQAHFAVVVAHINRQETPTTVVGNIEPQKSCRGNAAIVNVDNFGSLPADGKLLGVSGEEIGAA